MLKRIKKIKDIGRFKSTSNVQFGSVTLIYGPNCFGKSTVTDILRSLQGLDPLPINMRASLSSDAPIPEVGLTFSSDESSPETSVDFSSTWSAKAPQNILIFDSKFIDQNIFTGLSITRENKENLTNLILGHTSVQTAQEISVLKKELGIITRDLSQAEDSLKKNLGQADLGINLNDFLNTEKISEVELEESNKQNINNEIANLQKRLNDKEIIKDLLGLTDLETVDLDKIYFSINKVLTSEFTNLDDKKTVIIKNHLASNNSYQKDALFNWLKSGTTNFLNSGGETIENCNCPYCSQKLEAVTELINAYKEVFNSQFSGFENTVKTDINKIEVGLETFNVKIANILKVLLKNGNSKNRITDYIDKNNKELLHNISEIEAEIDRSINNVQSHLQTFNEVWKNQCKEKTAKIYASRSEMNKPMELLSAVRLLNELIGKYNEQIVYINELLELIKKEALQDSEKKSIDDLKNSLKQVDIKIKRYELDSDVTTINEYRNKKGNQETKISDLQKELEEKNKAYIDSYFSDVSNSFRDYGSADFNIKTVYRKRGSQPVYEPVIEFMGKEVTEGRLPYVFSESDRRSLGYSIFTTEIGRLTADEKKNTILILDDPITSFDSDKVSLICISILNFVRNFDQVIILTHNGSFYLKIFEMLKAKTTSLSSLRVVRKELTNDFENISDPKVIFDDHTRELEKIEEFLESRSQDSTNSIRSRLRPFLQTELEWRYKRYIIGREFIGIGDLTKHLLDNRVITSDLKNEIDNICAVLNGDHHEDETLLIEDTRTLAVKVLKLIYGEMNPQTLPVLELSSEEASNG